MNNIFCECRTYTEKLNTHSHDFAQLILPLKGILDIETDHKNLKLDEKYLFFVPPTCTHIFKSYKSNKFLVLDVPSHMLCSYDMENLQDGKQILFDERWKSIRFLILNEIGNSKGSNKSIDNLFHFFYQFIVEDYMPPSIVYIHKHFNDNINVQKLADIEHYSVAYYGEWFKKKMKTTPIEYIQNLRIERAKELLRNTDLNILQIAQEVGYTHHASLTRIFKELENIAPVDYRRKNREIAKR